MTIIGCRLVCAWVAANKGGHPCFVSVHGWVNGVLLGAVVLCQRCWECWVASGWLRVLIAFDIHVALWVVKKGHRAYRRQGWCLDDPCMRHPSRIGSCAMDLGGAVLGVVCAWSVRG